MSFLQDYRDAMARRTSPAPNAIPPTVGVGQEYKPVAMPYLRWDASGVTIVMPTSQVGKPPQERVLTHDETTGRWVLNPEQMSGTQSRMVNVGGTEYRVTTDGRVFKQEYPAAAYGATEWTDPATGQSLPANATQPGAETPALETEVTGDDVPVTIQQEFKTVGKKQASAPTAAEDAAGAATFGVTSPGGIAIPDVANPDNFYGSEYLEDNEGMDAAQLATYRALPPNLEMKIEKTYQTDPAMARHLAYTAQREGIGRPQYAPGSGGSVSAIVNTLTPAQMAQVQLAMMQTRYLPSSYVPSPIAGQEFREGFADLLADANLSGRSWISTLNTMAKRAAKYGAEQDQGPTTTTSTQIALTSRSSAEQLIQQAWQEKYGYAPTENQMAQFVSTLRGAERADPTTTKTTTQPDGDSTTVTRQSEVDPTAEALEYADEANPKARKEYQALNYFNLLAAATGDVSA